MKVLQPDPNSGGTLYGSTLYKTGLSCGKKASYMYEQFVAKAGNEQTQTDSALAVGTYFHKFMELYHTEQLTPDAIQVSDISDSDSATEAFRLFQYYASKITPTFYGKVVSVEDKIDESHPRWKEVCAAVGGIPFTLKPDMVVDVDDAAHSRLAGSGLHLPSPGRYMVDFKTRSRRDSMAQLKYEMDLQVLAYPIGYNAAVEGTGELDVKGMILCEIYKTKQPDHLFFFVPTATADTLNGLQASMRNSRRLIDAKLAMRGEACFAYSRACELITKGLCHGY